MGESSQAPACRRGRRDADCGPFDDRRQHRLSWTTRLRRRLARGRTWAGGLGEIGGSEPCMRSVGMIRPDASAHTRTIPDRSRTFVRRSRHRDPPGPSRRGSQSTGRRGYRRRAQTDHGCGRRRAGNLLQERRRSATHRDWSAFSLHDIRCLARRIWSRRVEGSTWGRIDDEPTTRIARASPWTLLGCRREFLD